MLSQGTLPHFPFEFILFFFLFLAWKRPSKYPVLNSKHLKDISWQELLGSGMIAVMIGAQYVA